jgi:hypothetical protein
VTLGVAMSVAAVACIGALRGSQAVSGMAGAHSIRCVGASAIWSLSGESGRRADIVETTRMTPLRTLALGHSGQANTLI